MPAYRITVEKAACDGIFACLVRDPRFVESDDGLVTVDPDVDSGDETDGSVVETTDRVVAEFDDDRIDDARQAAAACPTDAIAVEVVE